MIKFRCPSVLPLLAILTVLAFAVRVYGVGSGLPLIREPDEPKLINPAVRMVENLHWFRRTGDSHLLDPDYFIYPSLNIYALTLCFWVLREIPGLLSWDSGTYFLVGRVFTALIGSLTVPAGYLLARRFLKKDWALLAVSILALSPFHVELSHIVDEEILAALLATLSLVFSISVFEKGRWRDYCLSGLFAGFCASVKYYGVFALIPLIVAHILRAVERRDWKGLVSPKIVLGGIVSFLAFFTTSPFIVTRYSDTLRELATLNRRVSSGTLIDPKPFLPLYLFNFLRRSVALPFAVLSVLSLFWAFYKKNLKALILVSLPLAILIFLGFSEARNYRWLMLSLPMLVVVLAVFLKDVSFRLSRKLVLTLSVLAFAPLIFDVVLFDYSLVREDTRLLARRWFEENMAAGDAVLATAFGIPPVPEEFGVVRIPHIYYNESGAVDRDRAPSLDSLLSQSGAKYIVLSSQVYGNYYEEDYRRRFPETTRSWMQFYDEIDTRFTLVASFAPGKLFDRRPGPAIKIYDATR